MLVLTDDQTIEAVDRMPYVSSRTDWHRFTNAIVNNSLCCPSRATTLTGQYDTRTGVVHNLATGAFRDAQTLPVWLQAFNDGARGTDWGGVMAGSTLIAIPVVIFFLIVQRRIVAGLTAGAVKG